MVQINEESSTGPEYVKKFAKQMLKNSVFMGTFHEKRFVEYLKSYRDVVTISSEETEFLENVIAVKKRIEREFAQFPWIGITSPHGIGTPAGYNLWVELPIEIFGQYWFKVKTVEFLSDQIFLKLDVLRPVNNDSKSQSRHLSNSSQVSDLSINISLSDIQFWAKGNIHYFYNNILTAGNIKASIIFISILLSTLVLSIIDCIKYLLEYLLKLISEISKLIRAANPIFIHAINIVGKIIFGLYHLIAALCKKPPPPQPVYNAFVNYDPSGMPGPYVLNQNFQKALPGIYNRPRAAIKKIY